MIYYNNMNIDTINTKKYTNKAVAIRFSVSDGGDDNIVIHCHSDFEILYFIRGNVEYIIEGVQYTLSAGSLLLIPKNIVHGVKACGDGTYQRYVLSIFSDGLDPGGNELVHKVFCNDFYYENTDGYGIGYAFDDIFKAAELGDYPLTVSVLALLVKILDMQGSVKASQPVIAVSGTISQIITYLNENFTTSVTLDDISSKFFISKHHLNKLFRKATGVTVGEYVIYKRVYFARGLIQQGIRTGEAAERAGFSDYSSFYKAYTSRLGHSPQFDKQESIN